MIESVTLSNWKSHEQADFKFKPGTNVILGSMGSGKSSIFQAISFALFGTFSELKKREVKINELITRNARKRIAEIALSLKIQEKQQYTVKRKIDENRGNEGTVRDNEGALVAGPNTTAANEYIKNLLKVDDEIFLRTVYAIQNDIDMVLKYAPKERKKKIDELMGLDKFDRARDNSVKLRNIILKGREDLKKILAGFDKNEVEQVINDLEAQSQVLDKSISNSKQDLEKKKQAQEELKTKLQSLKEKFTAVSKLEERKLSLGKQISELRSKLEGKELESSSEEVERKVNEIKESVSSKKQEREKLNPQIEKLRNDLTEAEKKHYGAEQKKNDVGEKLNAIQQFKQSHPEINFSELSTEIKELKKNIDKKKELNKMIEVETRNLRQHLEELQRTDAACPLCEQELQETKREELISKKKKEIAEFQYKASGLKDELYKFEKRKQQIDEMIEANEKILEHISEESELKNKRDGLFSKLKSLSEEVIKLKAGVEQLSQNNKRIENEIQKLQEKSSELIEVKYMYESKQKVQALEQELKSVDSELEEKSKETSLLESTEKQFQELLKEIQQIETKLESYQELIREKEARKKDLLKKLKEIEELEHKVKLLELRTAFLDKLKTAIEATQLTLRDELILAVNEVMNRIWSDIYPYDKWQGIRLSASESDYVLQLRALDDKWVTVAGFASGGERMLASLAVRIAFARILAPGLNMLILDEPTHNLDDKAVQTLTEIIQEKISNMLDQIFIITHDERLAEAADNVVRI